MDREGEVTGSIEILARVTETDSTGLDDGSSGPGRVG